MMVSLRGALLNVSLIKISGHASDWTHAFSPSTDWVNEELATTCQMPKHCMSDENSMEESVLNDLERVTAQFTDKTRICFRDALYRLAESSKLSINSFQDGEAMMTSNDDTMRHKDKLFFPSRKAKKLEEARAHKRYLGLDPSEAETAKQTGGNRRCIVFKRFYQDPNLSAASVATASAMITMYLALYLTFQMLYTVECRLAF